MKEWKEKVIIQQVEELICRFREKRDGVELAKRRITEHEAIVSNLWEEVKTVLYELERRK